MVALTDVTTKAIDEARAAENGRHAEILINDGLLRQTVIALTKGTVLPEHNSPPAASIQVLGGALRVTGDEPVVLENGIIGALAHQRHSVEALEDSVFLLTAVVSVPGTDSYGGPGSRTGEVPKVEAEPPSDAEQAAQLRETDQQTGGGRIDG
ncbi:hypothetical protein ACFQS2_00620 [Brachybacterium sp. GCM10030267]|uniref:hypothetical protein n=1 Tax=unclassified Brachybacterium TaxID=2623841 RepID=UPI00362406FD